MNKRKRVTTYVSKTFRPLRLKVKTVRERVGSNESSPRPRGPSRFSGYPGRYFLSDNTPGRYRRRRTHPLSSAVRISLRAADPQDVRGAAVAAVETPVVVPVRVDTAQEPFGRAQRELHAVFAAHLRHCER